MREHPIYDVAIPAALIATPEWRGLSHPARSVLLLLWSRCDGWNNGTIPFAVRDGADWGMSKNTVQRALKALVAAGIIRQHSQSWVRLPSGHNARLWYIPAYDSPEYWPEDDDE